MDVTRQIVTHKVTASLIAARASGELQRHYKLRDGSLILTFTRMRDGLAATNIPIEARIVHLVDVYDALTHERVYKKAWTGPDAMQAILKGRGSMFDPEIVSAFEAAVAENGSWKFPEKN